MSEIKLAPKKLAPGMKVVVFTKPGGLWLTASESAAGLRTRRWVKFEVISVCNDGWIGIRNLAGTNWTAINSKGTDFIVIRSTAFADNHKPSYQTYLARCREKYRAKVLAKHNK